MKLGKKSRYRFAGISQSHYVAMTSSEVIQGGRLGDKPTCYGVIFDESISIGGVTGNIAWGHVTTRGHEKPCWFRVSSGSPRLHVFEELEGRIFNGFTTSNGEVVLSGGDSSFGHLYWTKSRHTIESNVFDDSRAWLATAYDSDSGKFLTVAKNDGPGLLLGWISEIGKDAEPETLSTQAVFGHTVLPYVSMVKGHIHLIVAIEHNSGDKPALYRLVGDTFDSLVCIEYQGSRIELGHWDSVKMLENGMLLVTEGQGLVVFPGHSEAIPVSELPGAPAAASKQALVDGAVLNDGSTMIALTQETFVVPSRS